MGGKAFSLALVGLGHIGKLQIEALSVGEDFQLIEACDANSAFRALVPSDCRFFLHLDDLLVATKADLIMVSTPNVTHFEVGRKVLEAGKNLLLEKPATSTAEELETLIEIATQSGTFFGVAFHAARALDVGWFVDRWRNCDLKLGALRSVQAGFYDPYVQSGNLDRRAISLGGSWSDSGINALSVVTHLLGSGAAQIENGRFTSSSKCDCSDIQATVDFNFSAEAGRGKGYIETSWMRGLNRKWTDLSFDDGTHIRLDHSNERVLRNGDLLADLQTSYPRLVNHYLGVFRLARRELERRRPDVEFIRETHRLLFSPLQTAASSFTRRIVQI